MNRVVTVGDSPLFHRVVQCPAVLDADPNRLRLLVTSRDEANHARILEVTVERAGERQWSCHDVRVLLEPSDIAADCCGVMPGSVVRMNGRSMLVGNAFAFRPGFHAWIFSVPLEIDRLTARVTGPATGLFRPDRESQRFRTTPTVVERGQDLCVVYAAADPYGSDGPRAPGFPTAYGLHWAPLEGTECGREHCWIWPNLRRSALATPTPTAGGDALWFCVRGDGIGCQGAYRLARARITESFAEPAIDWIPMGPPPTSPSNGLAYPELICFPGGPQQMLASIGEWGAGGIALVDLPAGG